MVAAKVQIRLTNLWGVWIGYDLERLRGEMRLLGYLFVPETIEEISLEVAERFEHYPVVAAALEILTQRYNAGGLYLGRLREERVS